MIRYRCSTALVALVVLTLSSCASIPESSEVRGEGWMDDGNSPVSVHAPEQDMDPLSLARSFIDASAEPQNGHKSARMHLTKRASEQWSPKPGMLLVEQVDTVPVPGSDPLPPGVQLVGLRAEKVGRLLPDRSFVPEQGTFHTRVRLKRQDDGQWRITNPLPRVVATRSSFNASYRPASVYFPNEDASGVVPDVRYIPSQPASTLPRRVVDLLMRGPSERVRPALRTALPGGAQPKTNASETADGALEVNLSDLGNVSAGTRRVIAAQVVFSLQSVSSARVRLKEEGTPLLSRHPELRPADLRPYAGTNAPTSDFPGLAVVDEHLVPLNNETRTVPGPAGNGEYNVLRAGVSPDGSRLAAVARSSDGVALRVGDEGSTRDGSELPELPVAGSYMSKPSWSDAEELWTSVDGHDVVRAVDGESGWNIDRVDVSAFGPQPGISDLRISPDGTRAAVVADGELVTAGVTEEDGAVALTRPTTLPAPHDANIKGVEWRSSDTLVTITDSNSNPVYDVSVDGLRWTPYTASNLGQPLNAVTVAPGGRVVVADRSALWESQDPDDMWGLLSERIGGDSLPVYPG